MRTHELAALLRRANELNLQLGETQESINVLISRLSVEHETTTAAFQKKLRSKIDQVRGPKAASQYLTSVASLLAAVGARKVSQVVESLAECMADMAVGTVQEFVDSISAAFAPAIKQANVPRVPSNEISSTQLAEYADRLTAAIGDEEKFASIVAEIRASKSIKMKHLEEISRRFLGYERPYGKKSEVFSAFDARRLQDLIQDSAFEALKRNAA